MARSFIGSPGSRWQRLVLLLLAIVAAGLYSQAQEPANTTAPPAADSPALASTLLDQEVALRAREELQVAEARLKARRAEQALATVQLEEANRICDFNQRMFKSGHIPDNVRFSGEVSLSSRQADLAQAEAETAVAEVRAQQARRRAENPELPTLAAYAPIAPEELWRQLRSLQRDHDHRQIASRR